MEEETKLKTQTNDNRLNNFDPNAQLEGDFADLTVDQARNRITSNLIDNKPKFQVQDEQPAVEGAGLTGVIESEQDAFTQRLEREADQAQVGEAESFKQLLGEFANFDTETEQQSRLYAKEGGVDDLQKELVDINQQIRAEQQSLRRQIERIEDRGGDPMAVQGKVDQVERASLRKQADLAVIQMGLQGRYDSAKAIADRAIKANLERQQLRLDVLQLNYDRNKSLFDKKEQRAFENAQANRQRELDREEAKLQEISNLSLDALQNGAPTSIVTAMRSAETPEQAIALGGSYIGLQDRISKGLANRSKLIDLALKGDKTSINQLGYDPRGFTEEALEENKAREGAYTTAVEGVDKATKAMQNLRGLDIVTSNFGAGGRLLSKIGNLGAGALGEHEESGLTSANKFLANADYVLTNLTLDKLGKLETPLTPVSDADLGLVKNASSVLSALAIYKSQGEGLPPKLVGFKGDVETVQSAIGEIVSGYQNHIDKVNAVQGLSAQDFNELQELLNQ